VVGGSATSTWNCEARLGKTDLDGSCCTFVYRRQSKCHSNSSCARSSNRRCPLVACTAMSLGRSSRAKPPCPIGTSFTDLRGRTGWSTCANCIIPYDGNQVVIHARHFNHIESRLKTRRFIIFVLCCTGKVDHTSYVRRSITFTRDSCFALNRPRRGYRTHQTSAAFYVDITPYQIHDEASAVLLPVTVEEAHAGKDATCQSHR
jgi:hypothetical protein